MEETQAAPLAAQEAGMAKEITKHLMAEISKRKDEEHKLKSADCRWKMQRSEGACWSRLA